MENLLLGLEGFGFLLGLLGPRSGYPLGVASETERIERTELLLFLRRNARSLGRNNSPLDGQNNTLQLLCQLDLLGRGVSLLGLAGLFGEEDQLGSVVLQASDVSLQRLDRLVGATNVDRNADGTSDVGGDARTL